MLFDIDNWKEIGATLARNKTRTFLTAFGIFWGVLMLALLWGGSQGFKSIMFANFDGFASNSALLMPGRTTMPYKGYQKGMFWNLTQDDVENIRRIVPELDVVSPTAQRNTTVKYRNKSHTNHTIMGVEPNYLRVFNPIITNGRFINDTDISADSKVCVLGKNAAATLFGLDDPVGKFVEADNVFYKVVGVAKGRSDISFGDRIDDCAFVPISTMRRTYNMGRNVNYITLIAKNGYTPSDLRSKIFRALRITHPLHPDDRNSMGFFDISEQFEMIDNVFTGIDVLILFVGLSSLIAGIIGVGNIMWIIVKERTKEFGIRRAIGAKPREIMKQIMQESVILTLVAGMLAICTSTGILALVNFIISQPGNFDGDMPFNKGDFQLSFTAALSIMILFVVLGSLAGSIPALKAMRIKPIEAMNDK